MKLTPSQNSLSYPETKSETMNQGEDSYTIPYNVTFKYKYKMPYCRKYHLMTIEYVILYKDRHTFICYGYWDPSNSEQKLNFNLIHGNMVLYGHFMDFID